MVSRKIGIVDYGIGNIASLQNAFEFYGHKTLLINQPLEFKMCDLIVISGIGNFTNSIQKIEKNGLRDSILDEKNKGKPIFGICLGMQLFADIGHEGGCTKGFGWVSGEIRRMDKCLVPHIGWENVKSDSKLFDGIKDNQFYFMHSYHFDIQDKKSVIGIVAYSNQKIVAAVQKENVIGVQFHPEKSQKYGLRFIRNVIKFYD